jgi:tRNA (Thr-GGU) A37 N-methylase
MAKTERVARTEERIVDVGSVDVVDGSSIVDVGGK